MEKQQNVKRGNTATNKSQHCLRFEPTFHIITIQHYNNYFTTPCFIRLLERSSEEREESKAAGEPHRISASSKPEASVNHPLMDFPYLTFLKITFFLIVTFPLWVFMLILVAAAFFVNSIAYMFGVNISLSFTVLQQLKRSYWLFTDEGNLMISYKPKLWQE